MTCDICQEKFEHDYLLWMHRRIHIPRERRLLCSFCPFVTSTSFEHTGSKGKGGVSLLASHIKNTHFRSIQCRVCKVFVAESRAEMSRHVYRTHMYDKKFYTKQFRDLVPNQTRRIAKIGTSQSIHPASMNSVIESRSKLRNSQTHLHHQQNIYCVL